MALGRPRTVSLAVVAALGATLCLGPWLGGPPPAAAAEPVLCHGLEATIIGTDDRDDLVGTPGPDVIHARGGRDHVEAAAGNDVVCGGSGADDLWGGPGRDRLLGGDDTRVAMHGDAYWIGDSLTGGPGDDVVVGGDGRGPDSVRFDHAPRGVEVDLRRGTATGAGDDQVLGVEAVWGSEFADRLVGRRSDFPEDLHVRLGLWGQGGPDRLRGDLELQGGPGRDRLLSAGAWHTDAGAGNDTLTYVPWAVDPPRVRYVYLRGGPGDDRIDATGAPRSGTDPGRGDDLVVGGNGSDGVGLSPGSDTVTTGSGNDFVGSGFGADVVRTGPGDDEVTVWCGTSDLDTGAGDDTVDNGGFHTAQCAEPGDDVLVGGPGRDTLSYRHLRLYRTAEGVTVDLAAGTVTGATGSDAVTSFQDVVGSSGVDHVTGDALDNVLDVGTGRDEAYGGAGDDRLLGGRGGDTLHGDDGTDTADGGEGTDSCAAETVTACEG